MQEKAFSKRETSIQNYSQGKKKIMLGLPFKTAFGPTDRLQKRGWPNCALCPLCKQTMETSDHLFVHYCFSIRI
jgi:hypothetical protein